MQLWSLLSAFFLTFWTSRAVGRLPLPLHGAMFIVAVHLISGGLLYVFVGLLKSYFVSFAFAQAQVVLIAQAVWLALDLAFTGYRTLAGKPESTSSR